MDEIGLFPALLFEKERTFVDTKERDRRQTSYWFYLVLEPRTSRFYKWTSTVSFLKRDW